MLLRQFRVRRLRAAHRLARRKRWPALAVATIAQELPVSSLIEHHHDMPAVETLAIRMAHAMLVYLSFSLLE